MSKECLKYKRASKKEKECPLYPNCGYCKFYKVVDNEAQIKKNMKRKKILSKLGIGLFYLIMPGAYSFAAVFALTVYLPKDVSLIPLIVFGSYFAMICILLSYTHNKSIEEIFELKERIKKLEELNK